MWLLKLLKDAQLGHVGRGEAIDTDVWPLPVPRDRAPPQPRHWYRISIVLFGAAVCDVRLCVRQDVIGMRPGAPPSD